MSKHWMQEIPPTHSYLYACLNIQSSVQSAYGNGFAICPMKFYSNTSEDVYEYKQCCRHLQTMAVLNILFIFYSD